MSAHRTLKDLFKAFSPNIGPGLLNDPGDAGTITPTMWGQICGVTTAGVSETRTLAQPTKSGVLCAVVHDTDDGDFALTVTGGYNAEADTAIAFAEAQDFVVFYSIKAGTSYYWRVLQQEGTDSGAHLRAMTPGSGIAGTAAACGGNVTKIGPVFKTEIFVDVAGLNSGTSAGDLIGKTLTANCHIGLLTAAKNGTIVYGQITCIETPATGDPDVDFYGTVLEATGTQDAALSTITNESLLLNNGDWTGAPATPIAMTALPGPGYLYMSDGGGTAATYSAGQFLVELWGV